MKVVLLTKSAQTTFICLLAKIMILGKDNFDLHQRALAKKLGKHYNTIYYALQELQQMNYLSVSGENSGTTISMNLEKLHLPFFLSFLNEHFSRKILNTIRNHLLAMKNDTKLARTKSILDYDVTHIKEILEQKSFLAKKLSCDLLTKVQEAYQLAQQPLDFEDYYSIISQVLESASDHLEVVYVKKTNYVQPRAIQHTQGKLGRL